MSEIIETRIQKTIENLEKNNMQVFLVSDKNEAVLKVKELLAPGALITCGGSVSLYESGVIDLLKSGDYQFLDRDKEGLTLDEKNDIYRKAFTSDFYLCSSNAITENGELYNVDGNANRVSAILYGPKTVIMVVGINKIVPDLKEAVKRVKTLVAPANASRLKFDTYCAKMGHCISVKDGDFNIDCSKGCDSAMRICADYVVSAHQRNKDRIKIILVKESLGY